MAVQPNFYAVLPASVRYDKELMDKAKLLYAEISALANKEGYCFASNKYFADLYGVSTRQIITLINNLEDKGYIKIERNVKSRKIFIFGGFTVKKTSPQGEENFTQQGEENFTHNNTSINNINNNIYTPEFEEWYQRYPNKFNKQQTFKNWNSALKQYKIEDLQKALDNYLRYIEQENVETKYITRSTNFLGKKSEFIAWIENDEQKENDSLPVSNPFTNEGYADRLRRFKDEY